MTTQQQSRISVREAAFTCYPVRDMARARRFYEGVLNLKPGVVTEVEGNCWVEYDLPGTTFSLGYMQNDAQHYPDWQALKINPFHRPVLALEVADFDQAVADLQASGCPIVMPVYESPICRMLTVEDPEGNTLMIHRRKEGQA